MPRTINKVFDANVYVNNASKHGQASEITCPDVTYVMNEYQSLGMFGTAKFWNGIEAMEATFKWTYPDNEAQLAMVNPIAAVDLMVRSSKAVWNNGGLVNEEPVVILMRGFPTTHQTGNFTRQTDVEIESTIAVNYYKLEVNRQEILEIDTINNIFKVNGVDIMAERRTNLGI